MCRSATSTSLSNLSGDSSTSILCHLPNRTIDRLKYHHQPQAPRPLFASPKDGHTLFHPMTGKKSQSKPSSSAEGCHFLGVDRSRGVPLAATIIANAPRWAPPELCTATILVLVLDSLDEGMKHEVWPIPLRRKWLEASGIR